MNGWHFSFRSMALKNQNWFKKTCEVSVKTGMIENIKWNHFYFVLIKALGKTKIQILKLDIQNCLQIILLYNIYTAQIIFWVRWSRIKCIILLLRIKILLVILLPFDNYKRKKCIL